MNILSREEILAASDIEQVTLEVPEWGGEVFIGMLTGEERDAFESSIMREQGKKMIVRTENLRAKFCAAVCRNADGTPMFKVADVAKLAKKSAKALDRIMDVGMSHNGMKKEDVDELLGNSEGEASATSGSASPATSASPAFEDSSAESPAESLPNG